MDRIEDVPAIADYMLDEMTERSWSLTDKARARFVTHEWPGNVREIHNVLAAAFARAKGGLG